MTDAEIEKDIYYYAFNYRNANISDANDWWLALKRHVKELEAITREKVLAELMKDNPPVATVNVMDGNYFTRWNHSFNKCPLADGEHNLYAMPPVPEGMQLVPTEPTEAMMNAYIDSPDSPDMEDWKIDFIGGYKAMLAAAKKG